MALPRASRYTALAIVVGLSVAGCAAKSAGEAAPAGESSAAAEAHPTSSAGESSGAVVTEEHPTPQVENS
ncbi:MAG TPA: hypothetical protein VII33_00440, partial [Nakamurella sp.]